MKTINKISSLLILIALSSLISTGCANLKNSEANKKDYLDEMIDITVELGWAIDDLIQLKEYPRDTPNLSKKLIENNNDFIDLMERVNKTKAPEEYRESHSEFWTAIHQYQKSSSSYHHVLSKTGDAKTNLANSEKYFKEGEERLERSNELLTIRSE